MLLSKLPDEPGLKKGEVDEIGFEQRFGEKKSRNILR